MNLRTSVTLITTELSKLVSGLSKSPPAGQTTLIVGGAPIGVAALVTELQGDLALYQSVADLDAQRKQAVAARDAASAVILVRLNAVRVALKGVLGPHNPLLETFGITPNKTRAPLTAAQDVARAAKAKATRAARHTMGRKQKAAITGATAAAATPAAPAKGA